MNDDYEEDLTIYPFLDEAIFSMNDKTIDWKVVDELTDADPSSEEYNDMLHKIGIKGRKNTWMNRNRRDNYDW